MNFQDAKQLCYDEMEKWGLLEAGWKVKHSKAVTIAGMCIYNTLEIQISEPIFAVESDDFCLDTIRHEIAHALDTSEGESQHGPTWKALAVEVGCDPKARFDSKAVDELILSKTKYVMTYGDKIVKTYMRKPNQKTLLGIKNYWVTGQKKETKGKLAVYAYNPRIHVEYV